MFVDFDLADHLINFAAPKTKVSYFVLCVFVCVFSAMGSHGSTPTVSGPLSGMFSASALKAISAEEAQDIAERTATSAAASATAEANVAETSTAAAATATVEAASADADSGSQGLPAQHGSAERVPPEAAAQEDTGPAEVQEPVGPQTRRSSPTRASTPSGAASRVARGGKATGSATPATVAQMVDSHVTKIEQMQLDGCPPGNCRTTGRFATSRRVIRHCRDARADFLIQRCHDSIRGKADRYDVSAHGRDTYDSRTAHRAGSAGEGDAHRDTTAAVTATV